MHDFAWQIGDSSAVSTPSKHWQSSSFDNEYGPSHTPRSGHSFGNVGVRQSVAPRLQAKLTVSHPGDSAEKEADNVADQVMKMPDPSPALARKEGDMAMPIRLQRKCTECEKDTAKAGEKESEDGGQSAQVQRMPEEKEDMQRAEDKEDEAQMQRAEDKEDEAQMQRAEDKEEEAQMQRAEDKEEEAQMQRAEDKEDEAQMQRAEDKEDEAQMQRAEDKEDEAQMQRAEDKEDEAQAKPRSDGVPSVTPKLESEIKTMHRGGAPLPRESREFFEPRLGADLSGVRVHTGSQAAGVARQVNAKAFTVGNNITFGAGQYSPSSSDGKRLMAHELTHVLQQRGRRS